MYSRLHVRCINLFKICNSDPLLARGFSRRPSHLLMADVDLDILVWCRKTLANCWAKYTLKIVLTDSGPV